LLNNLKLFADIKTVAFPVNGRIKVFVFCFMHYMAGYVNYLIAVKRAEQGERGENKGDLVM
jgi:hypothetical protein